ncbi:DsbA family protein [Hansschlegelia beijingensis]|uniref:Protein-disulfide isomerase n=1 Tax=Hansschlegelia beijingensis TaxID=1133344 RepID=A0A7W6GF09_9HYPH|nr:DsbA family protein [Hansschlegelia beijingensis]MBB3972422.1 protein-disulfide isomerase [Hansschlegelia beijingensis]
MRLFLRLALAGALALSAAWPAVAFDAKEKEEIGAVVREYLLQHPEVLLDAQRELQRRQEARLDEQRKGALKNYVAKIDASKLHAVMGDPKGDVTLVEFFDYNCGYCRRALRDLDALIAADPKLRIVLMELPVIRQESLGAAQVSLAVSHAAPDKFRAFHEKLLGGQSLATKSRALAVAKEVGLDPAKIEAAMNGPEVRKALLESKELADELGVEATPTFVIGDAVVPNTSSVVDDLQGRIAALRTCGKSVC